MPEGAAGIKPNGIPGSETYSKFIIQGQWQNPTTGINTVWIFNVNTDVPVPAFHSPGSDEDPMKLTLVGTYDQPTQFVGFDRFSGVIGQQKFYLRTDRGVVFKGTIVGGPDEGQEFVGGGSWIRS